MPAFMIDTAKTSSLEQATTAVYATGGKGNNRLIGWEGEKTMTFTVEDALISPMGLAVLSGAGLINPSRTNLSHVHITLDKYVNASNKAIVTLADLQEETGLELATSFNICKTTAVPAYATVLDGSGAGIQFLPNVEVGGTASETITDTIEVKANQDAEFTVTDGANKTVKLDFYLVMTQGVTEIEIKPNDFGGYFYVEAQTLFRREDSGKDMAAEVILPKVKVQSGFTFSMASSGDPSTFTFTMDAFPGYTQFDKTKKVSCKIQIIGTDDAAVTTETTHDHTATSDTPSFHKPDTVSVANSKKVGTNHIPSGVTFGTEYQENQGKASVVVNNNTIAVTVAGGVDSLNEWTSTDPGYSMLGDQPWIALDIDTGVNDVTKLTYNGTQLTSSDVADAAAWGLGAGHLILWIRANEVKTTPKVFTLAGNGITPVTVTVTVADAI